MPRRAKDRPLEKITLYLFRGDFAKLKRQYPRIGASDIVRSLVAGHLKSLADGQRQLDLDPEDLAP